MHLEIQTQTPQHNPPPSIPEQGSELTALNFIRTETVLSKLPVHNLSKKGRVNIEIIKEGPTGEVELKWEVSYSDRYGQARGLAYKLDTIVVDQKIDDLGRPLPQRICLGSLNQIAMQLGLEPDHGTTHKHLKRAFRQNAFAGITAKFKYKANDGTERTLEASFTRYSVIFTGEKFSDGSRADAVYIELNTTYHEVLNNAPMRPLDMDYKKQLPPAAQRFYEIVSYKIFTALKYNHPAAKLAYSEYCTFSAQQRYFSRAQAQKQMYKLHQPHKKSGYITSVEYEETIDQKGNPDWLMFYVPGPKARRDHAIATGKKLPRTIDTAAQSAEGERETRTHRPRQRRLNLRPAIQEQPQPAPTIIDYRFVAELTKRGISETDARTILASLPPGQPVLNQLEWGDLQVQSSRGKISNPPGFYISLLQRNIIPPATFESSQAREARHAAELAQQRAILEQAAVELAAQEESDSELERFKATARDQYQALFAQAQAQLFANHPKLADLARAHPDSALHDGAIRARMKQILKQGMDYATKPAFGQADPLKETSPASFAATLQTVLNRPQLKAPGMLAPGHLKPAKAGKP